MARQPKQAPVLTPAEKKAAKADLNLALKKVNEERAKYVSDQKAAAKSLATLLKEQAKAKAEAEKALATAQKKLDKAEAAAEQGRAKIAAKLAALDPAPATTVTA